MPIVFNLMNTRERKLRTRKGAERERGEQAMAKTLEIVGMKSRVCLVVDGYELDDVLQYNLEEDAQGVILTVKISIIDELVVHL